MACDGIRSLEPHPKVGDRCRPNDAPDPARNTNRGHSPEHLYPSNVRYGESRELSIWDIEHSGHRVVSWKSMTDKFR